MVSFLLWTLGIVAFLLILGIPKKVTRTARLWTKVHDRKNADDRALAEIYYGKLKTEFHAEIKADGAKSEWRWFRYGRILIPISIFCYVAAWIFKWAGFCGRLGALAAVIVIPGSWLVATWKLLGDGGKLEKADAKAFETVKKEQKRRDTAAHPTMTPPSRPEPRTGPVIPLAGESTVPHRPRYRSAPASSAPPTPSEPTTGS